MSTPFKERVKRAFGPVWPWIAAPVIFARVQRHRLRVTIARLEQHRVPQTWRWLTSCFARFDPDPVVFRIAIDINPFWERLTGVGWYLHQLLTQLANHEGLKLELYGPSVFVHEDDPGPAVELPAGTAIEYMVVSVPENLVIRRHWLIRILRRLETRLVRRRAYDVVFAPNFLLRRKFHRSAGAVVVTVHDLAARHFPWTLEQETLDALEAELGRTLDRASAILTPSQAVRDELGATGSVAVEVTAVHHGPGHLERYGDGRPPQGLPDRYALFVGTLEPRKNLVTLVDAWQQLAAEGAAIPLVMAGRWGWKDAQLRRRVEEASAAGWLVHLGYVEDDELAALYRGATLLACPSLYEGFGLPIIEALAAGCPVVCSELAVFAEVAGEAAVYVPATDAAAWQAAVRGLLADSGRRHELSRRGRERAQSFSWEKAASEALAVWRRASGRTAP